MKQMLPLLVILVVGALAAVLVLNQRQENPTPLESPRSTTSVSTATPSLKQSDQTQSGSRYVEYSRQSFEAAAGQRRVLFFYANWCPICVPADANFKANLDRIPEDVTLIRVNYNDTDTDSEERSLARQYGVTYQHTFVQIDPSGKVVTRWNGGQIDELLANLK